MRRDKKGKRQRKELLNELYKIDFATAQDLADEDKENMALKKDGINNKYNCFPFFLYFNE